MIIVYSLGLASIVFFAISFVAKCKASKLNYDIGKYGLLVGFERESWSLKCPIIEFQDSETTFRVATDYPDKNLSEDDIGITVRIRVKPDDKNGKKSYRIRLDNESSAKTVKTLKTNLAWVFFGIGIALAIISLAIFIIYRIAVNGN